MIGSGSFVALSRRETVNGFFVNSAAAEGRMAAAQVLTPGRMARFFAQPFGEIRAGAPEIYALLMEVKRFCGKGPAILAAAGPFVVRGRGPPPYVAVNKAEFLPFARFFRRSFRVWFSG